MTPPGLLELKMLLRSLPGAGRRDLQIGPPDLVSGYRALLLAAPRRALPYFSPTRSGMAPAEPTGRRKEERLAMAWFNAGALRIQGGSEIALVDYQFPLKSAMADEGIGKIDLLGLCAANSALAVIELKVEGNAEDRRIGLLEGLIYAAIVEANAATILAQLEEVKGHRVSQARPIILLAAPVDHWSSGYPSREALQSLADETARLLPIDIHLLTFDGDAVLDLGLDGARPRAAGEIVLSPVAHRAGVS